MQEIKTVHFLELTLEQKKSVILQEAAQILQIHIDNMEADQSFWDLVKELATHIAEMNIYLKLINQKDSFKDWLRQTLPEAKFIDAKINLKIPTGGKDEVNPTHT